MKAKTTSDKTGLWIDHRQAILVNVTGDGEETYRVLSKVESHGETQEVPADDSRQHALTGYLNTYYDDVIAHLRDAESIAIFGPGEAKGELRKRLDRDGADARIVAVETADNMTDPQFVAKVRAYFSH